METKCYLNEIWKPIKGYEGLYEVSTFGRVGSLNYRGHGQIALIRPETLKTGHLRVCLYKDNNTKRHLVHRLVAEAFIPNPNNLPCVHHDDENPGNNHVSNLKWCTHRQNMNYGTRNKRIKEHHCDKSKQVFQYTLNGEYLAAFKNANTAIKELNLKTTQANISSCCTGKRRQASGFVWKYKEKGEAS